MCKPQHVKDKVIGGYARRCPLCGAKVHTELTGMRLYKYKDSEDVFEFICCPTCYENLRYSTALEIDKEDFKNELLQPEINEYSKTKILLLDRYFVSMDIGMIANEYSDIAWVYISHNTKTKWGNSYYKITNKSNIIIHLKNGKKYTTASIKMKEDEIYSEIIEKMSKKNPNILIGYSYENLNNYKTIKKQNEK